MLEIDLIRHVKVAGESALYGCTDIAALEVENHALLQRLIANQQTSNAYQSIICSPLQRCQTLARKLANICQIPLEVNADFQEMNFGLFDGMPFEDMYFDGENADEGIVDGLGADGLNGIRGGNELLAWSLLEAFFQAPAKVILPEAERLADFNHRVIRAWKRTLEQQFSKIIAQRQVNELRLQKPKARVLIIAHGGVIRMILAHILHSDWQQASWHQNLQISNASLTRVCISVPIKSGSKGGTLVETKPIKDKQTNQQKCSLLDQQLHQQVITIAMPLLQENHDKI